MTAPFNGATNAAGHAHQSAAVRVVLALVHAYKVLLSPFYTGCCRFEPSCSTYMAGSVTTHGAIKGVWLGLRRLARCHPFGDHGYDPVPPA
jgi:putative membrane protein insertion efficiency factor